MPHIPNALLTTGDFCANTYDFVMPGQNLGAVCGTLPCLLGRDLRSSNFCCSSLHAAAFGRPRLGEDGDFSSSLLDNLAEKPR